MTMEEKKVKVSMELDKDVNNNPKVVHHNN